jgi:outer membrane protein insertion porin family
LFLLAWLSSAAGQEQDLPSLVDSAAVNSPNTLIAVVIQGNESTKEEIILREMKLQPGDAITDETIEADRLRIQNLGIFNRVEIDEIPTNRGVILLISVSEMWYIFPYPIIFRNERDWGKISVGAGLLHNNFRGRREIIDFSFWLGYNPSVRLTYTNPWIFGKLRFYTSVSVFAKKVRNLRGEVQGLKINENQIGFNWRIGKRFGHFTYFDVNVGYRQLTLSPRDSLLRTLSSSEKDKLPSYGFSFTHDSRDLWEYAHRGNFVQLWLQRTGWFGNLIDYVRYGADVRKYIPVGPTTLALRGTTNLSTGTLPVYDLVHFGFANRIRGHFKERDSGENLLMGSAEFRFPIRKITYHDWGPFQSMGRYGANLRFGISAGLFVDTGALWNQNSELSFDRFISGWGGGLHFFLPYQILLRTEYGFDEDWNGQFIIDMFAWF